MRKFGFSRMGLYRFIKNKTGCSYAVYVGSQKLGRAMRMLENTDMKIADVALSVGFSSQQRFNDIFRKHTAVTPLRYRQEKKQEKVNKM